MKHHAPTVRLARRGSARRTRWPPTSVSRLGVISIGAAVAVADATTGDWTSSVPTGPLIATTLGGEGGTGHRRPTREPLVVRIAFGTDERTAVTDHVRQVLAERGHDVDVVGEGDPWPDVGRRVGERVADGRCDVGVVSCWTGTGVSMAANKVPGVRAALCTDAETARGARRWNDANVLAFGLRLTTEAVVTEMLDAFLTTEPDAEEAATIARLAATPPAGAPGQPTSRSPAPDDR
jgi:ribose 5-phosphate isomerase B